MKINEAFNRYMREEIVAMNYSINTYNAYKYTRDTAAKYFGNKNIKKIDLTDVHNYYLWLVDRVSKNTARHYISDLRVVFKFCRKHNIKVMNPDEIRIPRAEKKVARFLSDDEYKIFESAAGQPIRGYSHRNLRRNVLIIKMLYETGLRVSELCALNRTSIRNRQFVVIGKSKDPRPCFITAELEEMIDDYLDMRDDDNEALFVADHNGLRVTPHNIQRVFRNVSRRANIGVVTPHTLRHSYATRFLDNGVDIRIVAALLGHQSVATTQNYTHVTNCLLKRTYDLTFA